VGEHRKQPPFDIGQPTVNDGQQRYLALRRGLLLWLRSQRLELTAGRRVDHVPAAFAQLLANRICRLEIACAAALDAIVEEPLCLGLIRSFWL
jgi:hypothetical protein